MSNQQTSNPLENISFSPKRYTSRMAANSSISRNFSGNTGLDNTINSGNFITTYNSYCDNGGTNSSRNYAEILRCLRTSKYELHRSRVREPVKGTCAWVTEHPKYKSWLENKGSGLLWLSADPGCGKSVTASFLVTHLNIHTDAIVCYFFFKDDNEEQRSATSALCAILHQLFVQRPSLCRYADKAFKAQGSRFVEKVDTLWGILVKATAEVECGDVICVVDALDECGEATIAPLIHHIIRLRWSQPSGIRLKFLVTSRPYHRIEIELGSPSTTIRLKGEEEVHAITADVMRVIDEGIKKFESRWKQHGRLAYLRDLLESSADRTFLWVSLVLEILEDSKDYSQKAFINIASTASCNLAELYTGILDKSMSPDGARLILNIVVAAARPLTLHEMSAAFNVRWERKSYMAFGGLSPGFENMVKSLCGLFVRVIDSKIYLVHQTAREFLIKGSLPGRGAWQYTLCPTESNFIMADICISYLAFQNFENNPVATNAGNVGLTKYALLDYAASHWADHFRESRARQMELFPSTKRICEHGSKRFLTWLKVYWETSGQYHPFPNDFTHLMIALWLGQGAVVERLLEEGDIITRSKGYGTALNIAALQNHRAVIKLLLQRNVEVYIGGKGYNILKVKKASKRKWVMDN